MTTVKKNSRKSKNKTVAKTKVRKTSSRKKRKPSLNGAIMDKTLHKRIRETLASIDKALVSIKKKVDSYKKEKKPTWAHLGDLGRILSLLKEI